MSNIELTVEQTLLSEDILAKYPGLRHLASTRLAAIEDGLEYISKESGPSGTLIDQVVQKFKQAPLEEVVNLYNHAVRDGRFINLLATDPNKTAELLDLRVSDEAVAALKWILSHVDEAPSIIAFAQNKDPFVGPVLAVAVIIAAAVGGGSLGWWAAGPPHAQAEIIPVVIDRSGQVKL